MSTQECNETPFADVFGHHVFCLFRWWFCLLFKEFQVPVRSFISVRFVTNTHTAARLFFLFFTSGWLSLLLLFPVTSFSLNYIKLVTNVLRPNTQAWDCRNSQLVLSMFLFRFDTVGVFSYDQLSSINIANAAYTLFFLHFPGVPYKAVETDRTWHQWAWEINNSGAWFYLSLYNTYIQVYYDRR